MGGGFDEMNETVEAGRAVRSDRFLAPILKVSMLSALLATVISALTFAVLSALPTGPRPDLTTRPSTLDIARTALLLCAITAVSCGSFGFLSGAAGSIWLCWRRRRIRSVKRLLAEAGIAGFLLGALFPFFDNLVTARRFSTSTLLSPIQFLLSPALGVVCALACVLVFHKYFIAEPAS
jgi:hypothetical protein